MTDQESLTTSERITLLQNISNWCDEIKRACEFDIYDLKYHNFTVDSNKVLDRISKIWSYVSKLEEEPIRHA